MGIILVKMVQIIIQNITESSMWNNLLLKNTVLRAESLGD